MARIVKVWKIGLVSFDTALKIQTALARKHLEAMKSGLDVNYDTLLLVEHKPVFTVGMRDGTDKREMQRLRNLGAEFKKTNRGGLITFHGPGQLVVYPILNLKHFKTSVRWYVNNLEETVIKTCRELDIKADRSQHTGVWVDDNKIAAIGIHATRYVTTHGISINCNNDLSWFDHIDPCGLADNGVTSVTLETGNVCTVEDLTPIFLRNFRKVFECKTPELEVSAQEDILTSVYSELMTDQLTEKQTGEVTDTLTEKDTDDKLADITVQ